MRLAVTSNSRTRDRLTVPVAATGPPLTLARMWLEAQLITGSPTDGASISSWTDATGNGFHATTSGSAGTANPVFKTGIVNSKPIVRFNGTSSGLDISSSIGSGLSAAELFIVSKVDNDPPGAGAQAGHVVQINGAASSSHFPFTDSNIYEGFMTTVRKTVGDPATSMSAAFHCYNVRTASGQFEAWLDNTQVFTTGTNTFTAGAATNFGYYIGHSNGTGNDRWYDGDVALIVICPAVLSSLDRATMRAYITAQYAVTF